MNLLTPLPAATTTAKLTAAQFIQDKLFASTLLNPFDNRPEILALRTVNSSATGLLEIRTMISNSFASGLPNQAQFGTHASLQEVLGGPLYEQPWAVLGELLGKLERQGIVL